MLTLRTVPPDAADFDVIPLIEGLVDHDHQAARQIAQRVQQRKGEDERCAADKREQRGDIDVDRRQHDDDAGKDEQPEEGADDKGLQQLRNLREATDPQAHEAPRDARGEDDQRQREEGDGDALQHRDSAIGPGQPFDEGPEKCPHAGKRGFLVENALAVGTKLLDERGVPSLAFERVDNKRVTLQQASALLDKPDDRPDFLLVRGGGTAHPRRLRARNLCRLVPHEIEPHSAHRFQLLCGERHEQMRERLDRDIGPGGAGDEIVGFGSVGLFGRRFDRLKQVCRLLGVPREGRGRHAGSAQRRQPHNKAARQSHHGVPRKAFIPFP
jgi:hypothetical protein